MKRAITIFCRSLQFYSNIQQKNAHFVNSQHTFNRTHISLTSSSFSTFSDQKNKPITSSKPYSTDIPEQKPKQNVQPPPPSPFENLINKITALRSQQLTPPIIQQISNEIKNLQTKIKPTEIQNKGLATKYFISLLFHKNYPYSQIINNSQLMEMIKGLCQSEIQIKIYGILEEERKGKNKDENTINDLYYDCFEDILERAQGDQKIKCEVLLYKSFGKYMYGNKNIEKGRKMLQKSSEKHKQLILIEYHKMQESVNTFKQENRKQKKKQYQKQHHELQLSALKQNIRRLMESNLQVLYLYHQTYLPNILQNNSASQRLQSIASVCYLIKQSMLVKTLVPKMQNYSLLYHKIMQIFYQLQYVAAAMNKDNQRIDKLHVQIEQFKKQSIYELSDSKLPQVQKQIVRVVFAIQLLLCKMNFKFDSQDAKNQLSECAMKMIENGRFQQGSLAKELIMRNLADFMKKFVQK